MVYLPARLGARTLCRLLLTAFAAASFHTARAETRLQPLHVFPAGFDAAFGIVSAPDGFFYGLSAESGGGRYAGCLYRLDAQGKAELVAQFPRLRSANEQIDIGANPVGRPVIGPDGSIYGRTYSGGAFGTGTIFRLHPSGTFTTVFHNPSSGGMELSFVTPEGDVYVTLAEGGSAHAGAIVRISPQGVATTLHSFVKETSADGATAAPYHPGNLFRARDGQIYGLTAFGGPVVKWYRRFSRIRVIGGGTFVQYRLDRRDGFGTLFRLDGPGQVTTLKTFAVGDRPASPSYQAPNGDLLGFGKVIPLDSGGDTFGAPVQLCRITPAGEVSMVQAFDDPVIGHPLASLLEADGALYGQTVDGGANASGTVFKLGADYTPSRIADFPRAQTSYSIGPLAFAGDGFLYGVTTGSGNIDQSITPGASGTPTALRAVKRNRTLRLQVDPLATGNHLPQVRGGSKTVPYHTLTTRVNVLANDRDLDGDHLTVESITAPPDVSVTQAGSSGRLHCVVSAPFVHSRVVQYRVSDGRGGVATGSLRLRPALQGLYRAALVSAIGEVTLQATRHGSFIGIVSVSGVDYRFRGTLNEYEIFTGVARSADGKTAPITLEVRGGSEHTVSGTVQVDGVDCAFGTPAAT